MGKPPARCGTAGVKGSGEFQVARKSVRSPRSEVGQAVTSDAGEDCHLSKRQEANLVYPFFGFRSKPYDEQLFDDSAQGQPLWDQNDAGAGLPRDEMLKMVRHGSEVM